MEATDYSRKLEQNGRILIPVKLREQMNLKAGQIYHFFIHEENGRKYICIDCGASANRDIEQAIKLLQANGMKIVQNDG